MNKNNASILTKFIILCISASLIAALTGCGLSMIVKKSDPVPEGMGMVVAHISNAVLTNENWDRIEVWSKTKKEVFYIYREPARESGIYEFPTTGHFSAALPPGIYHIDALKSFKGNHISTTTYTAPANDKLGQFKIQVGRLTDLGTILFYPEHWTMGFGAFELFSIGTNNTTDIFKYQNPIAFSSLSNKKTLGWLENTPRSTANVKPLAIANLPHFNQPVETKNGEIFAGGMLGKVFKRKISGEWVTLDTETLLEIYRIEESEKALYATSERLVLKSMDGGLSWQPLSLPAQSGRLEFFHVGADGTQYLYIHTESRVFNTYNLYSRKSGSDEWSLFISNSFDTGKVDNILPSMYHFSNRGGLSFTPENLSNFVLSDDSKSISRDIIGLLNLMRYFDDGGIYGIDLEIAFNLKNPTKNPAVSFYDPIRGEKDIRHRWKGGRVLDIYFTDRQTGYVAISLAGNAKSEILKTGDGGKTWVSIPGSNGASKVYVTRDGVILKISKDGTVYSTNNSSKGWKRERGTANLVAAMKVMRK